MKKIHTLGKQSDDNNNIKYIIIIIIIIIIEKWLNYYHEEKKRTNNPQCEMMLVKLSKVCDVVNTIIGGFVVRDMTVLLAKWLKRGGTWVSE